MGEDGCISDGLVSSQRPTYTSSVVCLSDALTTEPYM